jgi:hypothetical protein
MCTTSAECKTVLTTMLMFMSGIYPHMISHDIGWSGMVGLLGVLVGAGISWSNRPVGAGDFVGRCPVGVGDSLSCYPVGAGVSL